MNTYKVKLEIDTEVQAFTADDAEEYIKDILSVDKEIKSVKMISLKEK